MFTEEQQNTLWKWANNSKFDRPPGSGLNGMPLLSIGRCFEFIIDHNVPVKELMAALAQDFHDTPNVQLLDILWSSVKIILAKPKLSQSEQVAWGWIKPNELKPRGSMQQWMSKNQWKELTDGEMKRLWQWAGRMPSDTPRIFYNENDRPMLSIGRLLEFLVDNGMSFEDIFKQCILYENKEWVKMQLIDVLWDRVKLVLKLPVIK